MDMAAQVSFYFALSCFPFLLVLAALLGWVHRSASWDSFWYWLTNYLPTSAQDTVLMAEAMRAAVEAGRKAFLAGRIEKKLYATASSPLTGVVR